MGRCDVTGFELRMVHIDDFGPFEAMVRTDARWNGWAVCGFSIDEVSRISETLEGANRDYPVGDQNHVTIDGDGVWESSDMYADEYEDPRGRLVEFRVINGDRYYFVGDGWCWYEVSGDGEDGAA